MAHVDALAAKPRPAGSAAHRAAREYIVTALREGAGLGAVLLQESLLSYNPLARSSINLPELYS
jgi:hypothetical protein